MVPSCYTGGSSIQEAVALTEPSSDIAGRIRLARTRAQMEPAMLREQLRAWHQSVKDGIAPARDHRAKEPQSEDRRSHCGHHQRFTRVDSVWQGSIGTRVRRRHGNPRARDRYDRVDGRCSGSDVTTADNVPELARVGAQDEAETGQKTLIYHSCSHFRNNCSLNC